MANLERTMFREYDIRGRETEKELNPDSIELISKAYGTFLLKRGINKVVVGHDNRKTSEEFHKSAIKGLLSTGCRIFDIGVTLTPIFYWSQYHLKTKGGLMVTASHNPVGWNGVKLALGYSYTIIGPELEEIYQTIVSENFAKGEGKILGKKEVFPFYLNDIMGRVKITKKFKVVVNTGNGTAGLFFPEVLRKASCDTVEYLCNLDPSYPKYTPNPADEVMIKDTGRVVVEAGADFGFAMDGDGDRLGLVDEKGGIIWPDRYMILLSRLVLKKNPGAKIIFDVKCSQALEEDIKAHGGIPIMWKTGHSYIKQKLSQEKAVLAGEMSGHIFFAKGYYGFDDASFAALKLLEYFSTQNKKVSEIIQETPYYVSTPTLHVSCPDEKKYQAVEELTKEFKKEHRVIDINGARVLFGDAWGLVRASSNLPVLVLRFEAKTQKRLEEIQNIFKEKLNRFDFVGKEWSAG
ncbi:MAG: phosphomannomutase/phosphoglucomutase [Candidatus Nealsonbacteria bacterium]|nr:phosphomannomutase/phosphoglucomutase [Candidatus Nealsonbacteria bacterium]